MPSRSLERLNEQAQIGVRLLKEAILEYLAARVEGASSAQMIKDLGLKEVHKGKRSDKLLWGLHNLLLEDGMIRVDRRTTPHRWHLTDQS